jgi:hypothetical protein
MSNEFIDLIFSAGQASEGNGPKNPKRSVRKKYNRRKLWVAHQLEQLRYAAEDVLAQEGKVYKKAEIENLIAEIDRFVGATGLKYQPPDL